MRYGHIDNRLLEGWARDLGVSYVTKSAMVLWEETIGTNVVASAVLAKGPAVPVYDYRRP